MLVNFYFSQSLASSWVHLKDYDKYFKIPHFQDSYCFLKDISLFLVKSISLIQPTFIFLASYIWCEHESHSILLVSYLFGFLAKKILVDFKKENSAYQY